MRIVIDEQSVSIREAFRQVPGTFGFLSNLIFRFRGVKNSHWSIEDVVCLFASARTFLLLRSTAVSFSFISSLSGALVLQVKVIYFFFFNKFLLLDVDDLLFFREGDFV